MLCAGARLGLHLNDSNEVVRLDPSGLAARDGTLRVGDTLTAVNGVPTGGVRLVRDLLLEEGSLLRDGRLAEDGRLVRLSARRAVRTGLPRTSCGAALAGGGAVSTERGGQSRAARTGGQAVEQDRSGCGAVSSASPAPLGAGRVRPAGLERGERRSREPRESGESGGYDFVEAAEAGDALAEAEAGHDGTRAVRVEQGGLRVGLRVASIAEVASDGTEGQYSGMAAGASSSRPPARTAPPSNDVTAWSASRSAAGDIQQASSRPTGGMSTAVVSDAQWGSQRGLPMQRRDPQDVKREIEQRVGAGGAANNASAPESTPARPHRSPSHAIGTPKLSTY